MRVLALIAGLLLVCAAAVDAQDAAADAARQQWFAENVLLPIVAVTATQPTGPAATADTAGVTPEDPTVDTATARTPVKAPAKTSAPLRTALRTPAPKAPVVKRSAAPAGSGPGLKKVGNDVVDKAGKPFSIKGLGWYGFNIDQYGYLWGDSTRGVDSVTKDFRSNVYRIKELGFNAIRMAFAWDILAKTETLAPKACPVATPAEVIASLTPPGQSGSPSDPPPDVPGGICNAGMPTTSAYDQYVWSVGEMCRMDMLVSLDFHSNKGGDQTFYDPETFIANWVKLLKDVMAEDGCEGRIILDPVNEPDGYDCNWQACEAWTTLQEMYDRVFTALYDVCPDCLLLAEGAGQANGWSNYGDGFTTDQAKIKEIRAYIATRGQTLYADATPFFELIHSKVYQPNVVLSPHIYCPKVTMAIDHYEGEELYERLQWSFGDKQQQGFTYKGTTKKYPIINGEFGSTQEDAKEKACINSIATYMNKYNIDDWFYWSWNADSLDTGGILTEDWRTIDFMKIDWLAANLGLTPWYDA